MGGPRGRLGDDGSNSDSGAAGANREDFVYDPKREMSLNGDGYDESSSIASDSIGSNSTDDFNSTTTPGGTATVKEDAFADTLAKKLTRDVKVWRSIVSFMLLLTAILITVTTYLFLTADETNDFSVSVSLFVM